MALRKLQRLKEMSMNFLVKIKRSNPNFPLAEYISNLDCCEFVDSVSSEKIDGIAKISDEKEVQALINKFRFISQNVERIEKEYKFERDEKGALPFWISFKVRKGNIHEVENFLNRQKGILEAYLTESSIYIRGISNSMEEVNELWSNLYNEIGNTIDGRSRAKTYFIFKRFSKD
jgi:hypothetical protein